MFAFMQVVEEITKILKKHEVSTDELPRVFDHVRRRVSSSTPKSSEYESPSPDYSSADDLGRYDVRPGRPYPDTFQPPFEKGAGDTDSEREE